MIEIQKVDTQHGLMGWEYGEVCLGYMLSEYCTGAPNGARWCSSVPVGVSHTHYRTAIQETVRKSYENAPPKEAFGHILWVF